MSGLYNIVSPPGPDASNRSRGGMAMRRVHISRPPLSLNGEQLGNTAEEILAQSRLIRRNGRQDCGKKGFCRGF